jgi:hypothetical protein
MTELAARFTQVKFLMVLFLLRDLGDVVLQAKFMMLMDVRIF